MYILYIFYIHCIINFKLFIVYFHFFIFLFFHFSFFENNCFNMICVCTSLIYIFILAMAMLKGNYLKANLYLCMFLIIFAFGLILLIWTEDGVT